MNGPVIGLTGDRNCKPLLALTLMIIGITAGLMAGCTTQGRADAGAVAPAAVPDAKIDLEAEYLIGPSKVRELGYRIDHQSRVFPEGESGVKHLAVQRDSAFVLDGHNFLTRLRRADGHRLWRIPVADPLDDIYGITYLPEDNLVMLMVGGHVAVLDRTTGSLLDKQDLGQIASTAPVVYGGLLIYGSRNGQVVWHSFEVGYQWRGYQVSSAIRLAPRLVGNDVAVVSSDGVVMVLDVPSAVALWEKRLLSGVEAEPAVGFGLLYIAGLDQYVWALDLRTGRTAWRYLSEAPLVCPPSLVDDRLYQHIPSEGMVCFAARPVDSPGGEIIWTTPDVRGRVLGPRGNRLLVWDEHGRQMTLLDSERGAVMTTIDLPDVRHVLMNDSEPWDLYAASDDGRVIRLVPRN
ncbi:MAG: outer membrane protein assembly factor BamB family protein [Planctomycetota bacterium]|jgi:outer membrane protein assembly factor BamB